LSADPVGELVLEVLGMASPERVALSDMICTGLQLVEHCQDVGEDLGAGRVYLPLEDMQRFGCTVQDLSAPSAPPPLRAVVAYELERARDLFDRGAPLIDELHGRPRVAVAAFLAGGRAAAAAIERAGCDVLAGQPRASRGQLLLALLATLRERRDGRVTA
jgi:phytoene/squalene synthetase